MDLDKKLKIMENRNTLLEKENKKLKERTCTKAVHLE